MSATYSTKQLVILILGPLLGLTTYFLLAGLLTQEAQLLAALTVQTLIWWFFEALPPAVTGLVFACFASVLGIASTEKVFAPFANPVIYFFMGGFFLAKAIEIHGVAERILFSLDRFPWIKGHPYRVSAVIILFTALLSAFLNNTATAALVLPFAISLSKKSFSHHHKAQVHLILGVAYAASLGGALTVFGTAPNMISIGILRETTQETINFVSWMKYSLPIFLPLIFILCLRMLLLGRHHRVHWNTLNTELPCPSFSIAAKRSLVFLLISMVLLVAVSLCKPFAFLGETNAILIPALFLFIVPSGSRPGPLLTWNEARDIDWSCLILFGAGLSMGGLIFSTGLAKVIGQSLQSLGSHPHLFLIALVVSVVLLTEFASNTASVTLMVPIALAVAKESGLPFAPSAAAVALAASLGLMLPVGTPPNALAFGTGLVTTKQMIRKGIYFDLLGILLCILVFWWFF